jgi:hypothetical protein
MVDLPVNIVLLGSNKNRTGSTCRGRCSYSSLISTGAWIGASVSEMTRVPTSKTPPVQLATRLKHRGSSEHSDS